jgi:phage pi2 protein 07
LVNLDKEDWSLPTDKDQLKQLVDKLVASKTTSAFKTEYKLDVKDFRDVLANRPEIVKELSLEGVVFGPVEPHLSFRKK